MKKNFKKVIMVLLAGIMLTGMAACSSKPATAGSETALSGSTEPTASDNAHQTKSETVSAKETLTVAANREPVSLDPTDVTVTYATLIDSHIYDCLLKMDKDLNIIPWLAESYEQVDDLTWKFNLRQGVKFHNGEEMTSKDVLYSFVRCYSQPAAAVNVQFIDKNSFETPDDYTFILKTTQPYAFLEAQLCHESLSILNEKAVTEAGDDYGRNPVGTGSYKFVSWTSGDNITVERNDNFWGEAPLMKTIVFRMITENSARAINLESGDVDLVIDIQESDAERIKDGEDTNLVSEPAASVRYFAFNCRHDVFKDKKVRQAMVHATDLESIRRVAYGEHTSTPSMITPIPPGFSGRNENLSAYEYNPEKAKELLAEAGVGDGFTVYYIYLASTINNMIAEMVQAMWAEVGVTLELNPMESGKLSTTMNNAEQDFCLAGTSIPSFETGKGLYDFFYSGSIGNTFNRSYLDSPEIDEIILQISTEMDSSKRDELCIRAQEMINDESPVMVICHLNNLIGMRSDVRGFEYIPNQRYDLGKVYFVEE